MWSAVSSHIDEFKLEAAFLAWMAAAKHLLCAFNIIKCSTSPEDVYGNAASIFIVIENEQTPSELFQGVWLFVGNHIVRLKPASRFKIDWQ